MEIYMDIDDIRGTINYGHLEGEVNFSEEEEKDFQTLLTKELDDEELTEEEDDRLEKYKEIIINHSQFIIDDYDIYNPGEYCWKDLLY